MTAPAAVEIYLILPDGRRVEVAACLPTYCTLREPQELPACDAIVTVVIDGEKHVRLVRLKGGSGKTQGFEA